MHYHVVLTIDGQGDCTGTFDTWQEAEAEAAAMVRQRDDWAPRRYPGRSWRVGEVAVYLDRRTGSGGCRNELAVIRCHVDGSEPRPACGVWRRAVPA